MKSNNALYYIHEQLVNYLNPLDLQVYILTDFYFVRQLNLRDIRTIRIEGPILVVVPLAGDIEEFDISYCRIAGPWYLNDMFEGLEIDYINTVGLYGSDLNYFFFYF